MPIYIIAAKLTREGARNEGGYAEQLEAAAEVRKQHGGRLIAGYVTFGRYDLVFISEYPDQKEALAVVETNLAKGEFTYEVLEAIPVEEFLKKMK
jgi:uncharacterized protein with GYD domain